MNSVIKYGVIIGVVGIAMQAILYSISVKLMLGDGSVVAALIALGLYIYFGLKARKDNGGYFTFGEAFKSIMTMILIAGVLSSTFQAILYKVIDPSIEIEVKDKAVELTESIIDFFNVPEEQADEMLAQAEEQDYRMTWSSLIKNFLILSVGFGGILSLIIALSIKKRDPNSLDY